MRLSVAPYVFCSILLRDKVLRHDALTSIRRGFKLKELGKLGIKGIIKNVYVFRFMAIMPKGG